MDPGADARQVHGGLAGGIAAPDDDHVAVLAGGGLASARPVVDPAAEQLVDALDLEPAPDHPGAGDADRRLHRDAVVDDGLEAAAGFRVSAGDGVADRQFGPEAFRLAPGEAGQLGAADALGEAEEVLDQGRVGRLPARQVLFQDQGREPVGSGVDRRREPGGAGADYHQVVVALRGGGADVPVREDALDGGSGDRLIAGEHDRQVVLAEAMCRQDLGRALAARLDPGEWLGRPGEEVPHALVLLAEQAANHGHIGARRDSRLRF